MQCITHIAPAIAAFFYGRIIVLMFFSPATDNTADVVVPSIMTTAAVGVAAAVTVLVGVLPQPLLNAVVNSGLFVR